MKYRKNKKKRTWQTSVKRAGALVLTAAMIGNGAGLAPLMAADPQSQADQEPAADQTENVTVSTGEQQVEDTADLSNEELFEGYLYRMFYEDAPVPYSMDFGTGSSSQLNPEEKKLYTKLKTVLEEIADGTRTSTEFEIDMELSGTYSPVDGDDAADKAAAEAAVSSYLQNELNLEKVVNMILADCPYELYWFKKSKGYTLSYSLSRESGGTFKVRKLFFGFQTASDYAVKTDGSQYDPYTVDAKEVQRAKAAKAKADQIVIKYAAESDYDKLHAYLTEICDLNVYNTGAASATGLTVNDPWQLVAVFDGDDSTNVVCEGYAKAFAYLFENSSFTNDLKCYIVSGLLSGEEGTQGAGGHMWNVVTMEDGKNYIVDVTNCDTGTIGSPDQLFLAGMQVSADNKYAFENSNGQKAYFQYKEDTKAIYPDSVLEISGDAYTPATKADQEALTINAADKTYGDAAFELSADGGSGTGQVRFQVPADNGVLSINGTTATIIGAGKVTITAVKAADNDFNKATAECELTVAKKTLKPAISGTVSKSYDGTTSVEDADVNTLKIILDGVLDTDRDKVAAAAEYTYADAETGTGKTVNAVNITLTGSAEGNYILDGNAASADVGTITEPKKDQEPLVITPVDDKTYGDEPFMLSVSGGSGEGAVSYSVLPDNGVLAIDGAAAAIIGAGEVTITAVKAGDAEFNKTSASYVLTVAKKALIPSILGSVSKKYDGTVSVSNAVTNTLEIALDGVLDADQGKVTASAEFSYADAQVGTNKAVQAANIVLSGEAAHNYILNTAQAAASVGTIEQAGGNSSGSSSSGGNISGGSWGGSYPGGSYVPVNNSQVTTPTNSNTADTSPNTPENTETGTTKTDTKTNPDGSITTTVITTDITGKVTKTTATTTEQIDASTTKVTETVTTDAGTTKTETVTEKKSDGSVIKTETVTSADNKVTTVETTTKKDGSAIKVVKENSTNTKGKEVSITATTDMDSAGTVTEKKTETRIDGIAPGASAAVTVREDGTGTVTSAAASVERTLSSGNKAMLTGNIISQITEAAGQQQVQITMTVKDAKGNRIYKVKADAQDLTAGNNLYIYKLNVSSGEYVMVNAKTYKVNQAGSISVSMKENNTYQLVTKSRADAINKDILRTVSVKKSAVTMKKGKSTVAALSSRLNKENVKRISYASSKKSVASVSKDGKVTAKKAGTATIKVKITLKNGAVKTVSMKVTVK